MSGSEYLMIPREGVSDDIATIDVSAEVEAQSTQFEIEQRDGLMAGTARWNTDAGRLESYEGVQSMDMSIPMQGITVSSKTKTTLDYKFVEDLGAAMTAGLPASDDGNSKD